MGEKLAIETLRDGQPRFEFLRFADPVLMEMLQRGADTTRTISRHCLA